jgi:hypothetical protein
MTSAQSILETAKRLLVDEETLAVEKDLDEFLEQEAEEEAEEYEEAVVEAHVDEVNLSN